MPTALRDMQPWRRALVEHGLTLEWLARKTGRPLSTVRAYSAGVRNPKPEWIGLAEAAIDEHVRSVAA